jgi:hypothetical protein
VTRGERIWNRTWKGLLALGAFLYINEYLCPILWLSRPITGTVVDARTHAPIAGAVVSATWDLVASTAGGPGPMGPDRIVEVVSDAQGRFRIDGWMEFHPNSGQIPEDAPRLWILRRGYLPFHAPYKERANSIISVSLPEPVVLEPLSGNVEVERASVMKWVNDQSQHLSAWPYRWPQLCRSVAEWRALARQVQVRDDGGGIAFELDLTKEC